MGTLEEQINRPYAEVWLESLRGRKRCEWCGDDDKPLNKAGLCQSCKRVEKRIAKLKAETGAGLGAMDRFSQSSLTRELKISEKMKELCEIDGAEVESILNDDGFPAAKLEEMLCDLSFAVCGDRQLHFHIATRLGWTFNMAQRRIFGYLLWETFKADRKRKRMKTASHVLNLEAGSPMSDS